MKIGLVVNVLDSDEKGATNFRLAAEGVNQGHEVWLMSTGQFAYNEDDTVGALARTVPGGRCSAEKFLELIKSKRAKQKWISVDDLDVLMLRSNPAAQRVWAQSAGVHFGRLAMRRGVIVVNDPNGLSKAMNKLYLQTFPEAVRPRTLITRNHARIEAFAEKEGTVVLKPLQGSGGAGVFLLRPQDRANLEQIIHAVARDGYVIVQKYLEEAANGDTRLFVMNGLPLRYKGKYAAFRRIRTGEDMRSNIHAGGRLRRAEINDTMLHLAEMVRPRLVEDGMFLVGLDIVGDKLMEINVFSPGGLGSAQRFEKVNFATAVIDALERKVEYMKSYRGNLRNIDLATL